MKGIKFFSFVASILLPQALSQTMFLGPVDTPNPTFIDETAAPTEVIRPTRRPTFIDETAEPRPTPEPTEVGGVTPVPTLLIETTAPVIETAAPTLGVIRPTPEPTELLTGTPTFEIEDPDAPATAAPVTPRPTPIATKSSKCTKNAKACDNGQTNPKPRE
eukprot:scaffold22052_cov36-Cyclotella_meneghiniana.AAC.2